MKLDRRRHESEFNALYNAHYGAVRAYAWRRDPDLVDDVVAEAFLVAWRRLEDIPPDAPLPWLLAAARNVHLNMRRSQRRRLQRESLDAARKPVLDEGPPGEGLPEEEARIWGLVEQLPERDREVLLLVAWEALDRAAIAQVLGCSQANVALRLFRARRRFRALLGGAADAPSLACSRLGPRPSTLAQGVHHD
jgi:RNA polymerase sigma factor (sigma-70 family)